MTKRPRRWKMERALCVVCMRDVAVRVPKGGDGSAVFPVKHNVPGRSAAGLQPVACVGSFYDAITKPTTPEGTR